MKLDVTLKFLELGDVTSRNLEFLHCDDVWRSHGEEATTETNLLEIRRGIRSTSVSGPSPSWSRQRTVRTGSGTGQG